MKQISRAVLAVVLTFGAVACVELVEDATFVVNFTGLTAVFNLPQGNVAFTNVCTTLTADQYLDADVDALSGARVTDVRVRTIGSFGGSLTSLAVTVNNALFVTGSGAWSDYHEQQSALTSGAIQVHDAGVNALVAAANSRTNLTFCATGAVDQPLPAGLSLEVEVLGQVDAQL